MAVKNVGGHAVTSVLGQSDHAVAYSAQPQFNVSPGATDHKGPKAGSGFPPAGAKKKTSVTGPYTGMTTY